MRHLMSPLDLTVEELDKLLDLAQDIEANPEKYALHAKEKNLPHYSMSRVQEHV